MVEELLAAVAELLAAPTAPAEDADLAETLVQLPPSRCQRTSYRRTPEIRPISSVAVDDVVPLIFGVEGAGGGPPSFPSRRAERMQPHQPRLGRLLPVCSPG